MVHLETVGHLLCRLGLHSYEIVRDTYVHKYRACQRPHCQYRDVRKVSGGHQPVDPEWERPAFDDRPHID